MEVELSFTKAMDLLRLAEMAAARHMGVNLQDIVEAFGCDYRTAQRMTRALEDTFPAVVTHQDASRRKFWRLPGRSAQMVFAQGLREPELTALEIAIRQCDREGAAEDAGHLRRLRDRLIAAMPAFDARRADDRHLGPRDRRAPADRDHARSLPGRHPDMARPDETRQGRALQAQQADTATQPIRSWAPSHRARCPRPR